MINYLTKPRKIKNVRQYRFLSFASNLSNKHEKQLLDTKK